MSGWLIPAGYGAVWGIYGWRLGVYMLDKMARDNMRDHPYSYKTQDGVQNLIDGERGMMLFFGLALALLWPVVLPARTVYRLLSGRGLMTTPIERELAERAELEQLRRLAREHHLPMPGQEQ